MLTDRKRDILNLIVRDHIASGTPIGSEAMARRHGLPVSPATIRNDVAELEREGYLTRPHQSAGSVPRDRGYRVYVETVASMQAAQVPRSVRKTIRKKLAEVERDVDEWASVAAAVLAGFVGNMAIATFPKAQESRVRHIDLVRLQDLLVLLIVVFQQARLKRHLIRLTKPVDPTSLQTSANRVNHMLQGLTRSEIEAKEMTLSAFEQELVSTAAEMLSEEDREEHREHYMDGLHNLLGQPEFAEKERVRAVVESVEDGSLAQAILDEAPDAAVVRVVIGQENRENLLWPLSVVIVRYGIPGEAVGSLGAVGPVRMEYTRTIVGVELLADVMGEMVESFHGG